MAGFNMRSLDGYGGTHLGSQDTSPRHDQPSPPSLQVPHHHSSSSKEVSPVDSPHSVSPPGHHPAPRHQQPPPNTNSSSGLQLHQQHSPGKEALHYATAFPPPPVSVLTPVTAAQQQNAPPTDPFSALGQLGQDLRLSHPHITQWLQHTSSSGPHSPVKHEPMSPRQDSHSSGSDYAPADYR